MTEHFISMSVLIFLVKVRPEIRTSLLAVAEGDRDRFIEIQKKKRLHNVTHMGMKYAYTLNFYLLSNFYYIYIHNKDKRICHVCTNYKLKPIEIETSYTYIYINTHI